MELIKIENVKDTDLTHIFECGQVFRWRPTAGNEKLRLFQLTARRSAKLP